MADWAKLPEGVVTIVAAKLDGPRWQMVPLLGSVCKPWRADIIVTKAIMPRGAEVPVWQVLQKTPKLQSLTVIGSDGEASRSLLEEIRNFLHLVPELDIFVFSDCELKNCEMPLSWCLRKKTRELTLDRCSLTSCTIHQLDYFQHLTSLTVKLFRYTCYYPTTEFNIGLWNTIFTELPSLQSFCLHYFDNDSTIAVSPNLPNLTSLSINNSSIRRPYFLRGLLSLKHLDFKFAVLPNKEIDIDIMSVFPETITSLNLLCSNTLFRHTSRLESLSSLSLESEVKVTDAVIAEFESMPSLTRLSLKKLDCITDAGLMNLARSSKLERLEIILCKQVTQLGVFALHAAAPSLNIVLYI